MINGTTKMSRYLRIRTPYDGLEDCSPYIGEELVPPDEGGDVEAQLDAPMDNDGVSSNIRTASFNKILRREHIEMGMGTLILERIQSAQRAVSAVISDMYTFAHMAALLVRTLRI